jgi:hypothetical protein
MSEPADKPDPKPGAGADISPGRQALPNPSERIERDPEAAEGPADGMDLDGLEGATGRPIGDRTGAIEQRVAETEAHTAPSTHAASRAEGERRRSRRAEAAPAPEGEAPSAGAEATAQPVAPAPEGDDDDGDEAEPKPRKPRRGKSS